MLRKWILITEYWVVKYYGNLHLHQLRIMKLYQLGGITKDIANSELRVIYSKMRVCRIFDHNIIKMKAKVQSINIA